MEKNSQQAISSGDTEEGRGSAENLALSNRAKKIIIADDDKGIIHLFKRSLKQNFRLSWAEDGYESVEKIATLPSTDLIILDCNMPGLSGLKALRTVETMIQRDPQLGDMWEDRKIPFVICTVKQPEEVEMTDYEHFQLVDFWKKPITYQEILARVDSVFQRIKGGVQWN